MVPAATPSITFSSDFSFDFDPTDGITAGQYDFIGIATHALGFVSGVDVLNFNSPSNGTFQADRFTYVSPLDLYRFSADATAAFPGARDWAADTRTKYFSIDGGVTQIAGFAAG
jgi:hypothetical protein